MSTFDAIYFYGVFMPWCLAKLDIARRKLRGGGMGDDGIGHGW